jgi:outer membrane biosynthesis protein TonB
MIPRLLVPEGARLPEDAGATARRRPTNLDERTLVPAMLPVVPLNGQSSIPSNLPLESIAARVVVPRDINREAYVVPEERLSLPPQPTELDERITVPVGAAPPIVIAPPSGPAPDIVEPDVFLTGDVNLVPEPPKQDNAAKWQFYTRVGSITFHILFLIVLLSWNSIFPQREPSREETEIARKQLTYLLPGKFDPEPEIRPKPPAPAVKVDPRTIRKVAPPAPTPPPPQPVPERPKESLPSAPVPKLEASAQPPPSAPEPKPDAPKVQPKLEIPDMPQVQKGLLLPKTSSPGQSIQDSLRASKPSGPRPIVGGGAIPSTGGQGRGSTAYGGLEMLTPDQGVDFSGYLQRVYFTVKRNWFAVMPTSAQLGERGIVVLTFRIMRDGSVPSPEPIIQRNSGKEPLDRAAFSSIRASNPFEPLPPQFTGPYIELRYTYLYNIPPDQWPQ